MRQLSGDNKRLGRVTSDYWLLFSELAIDAAARRPPTKYKQHYSGNGKEAGSPCEYWGVSPLTLFLHPQKNNSRHKLESDDQVPEYPTPYRPQPIYWSG